MGENSEVFPVDDGFHVAGVAVVTGRAVACDSAVVVWVTKLCTDKNVNVSIFIGLFHVDAFIFVMEVGRAENLCKRSSTLNYFSICSSEIFLNSSRVDLFKNFYLSSST